MAWVAPHVFVVNELVTAATMNGITSSLGEIWHEVAYAEFTTTVTATSSAEASAVTVVSAGATTFSGSAQARVEFFSPSYSTSDNTNGIVLTLFDGGTSTPVGRLWRAGNTNLGFTGNGQGGIFAAREFTPSAAIHTYLVGINDFGAVTSSHANVVAGTGGSGALLPGHIRVLQKG